MVTRLARDHKNGRIGVSRRSAYDLATVCDYPRLFVTTRSLIPRPNNCTSMAALPQHIAVSLWLTGNPPPNIQEALPPLLHLIGSISISNGSSSEMFLVQHLTLDQRYSSGLLTKLARTGF